MSARIRRSSVLAACLAFASIGLGAGCATVAPYEREHLSRPSMDFARESGEATFRAHEQESREGAMGSAGLAGAGGGCGCN